MLDNFIDKFNQVSFKRKYGRYIKVDILKSIEYFVKKDTNMLEYLYLKYKEKGIDFNNDDYEINVKVSLEGNGFRFFQYFILYITISQHSTRKTVIGEYLHTGTRFIL